MDKIRSFRVVDRWTQGQHRLGSDFVVARSTPSPSFHDRGVWFNFRVLPIHEPGAAWEQSGAKHVPPPAPNSAGSFRPCGSRLVELLGLFYWPYQP
jgi:hypothetical protein